MYMLLAALVALATLNVRLAPLRVSPAAMMAGRGFGRAANPGGTGQPKKKPSKPSSKRRGRAPPRQKIGSLEAKLLQEHAASCAAAEATFAVCASDGDGEYAAGWTAHPVPAGAVSETLYSADQPLLLESEGPLLSESECGALTNAMLLHGAAGGWDSRYPLAGYTREVKVSDMPAALEMLNGALRSTLLPAAASAFGLDASHLRVNEVQRRDGQRVWTTRALILPL